VAANAAKQKQEIKMFTRKSILAVATFAALGTAALAPTSASAWGGHSGGHFGGHFGGGHFGGHFGGHWGGHFGGWGHGWGHGFGWNRGSGWGHRYGWGGWGYRHFGWRWWNRPYGAYGGYGYAANSYPAYDQTSSGPSAPQATNQGCLVKGYLPDGSVVFTNTCTHESAIAEQDTGPQGPQGPRPGPQLGPQGMPRPR